MTLAQKIQSKKAKIGIIGLGYVGYPLSIAFAGSGFSVVGLDEDLQKIKKLNNGKQILKHHEPSKLRDVIKNNSFKATSDFSIIKKLDVIIICVPTPLDKYRQPDLSAVKESAKSVAKYLQPNKLIILESTTYPGTTDEVLSKILSGNGLKENKDFFLAYSPEREDPGNKDFSTQTIPKLIGANTPKARKLANDLYKSVISETFVLNSTKSAEAAKLTENIFRCVNIALVNELKMIFDSMDVDIWEVIQGASSKPFGYMPFYPGPGLGGHCIPIDPFYLAYKAKEFSHSTRFIELAGEINTAMPNYVIEKISKALNDENKTINGSKILILGVAYKKDIDDVRESPAIFIFSQLLKLGSKVKYHDNFVKKLTLEKKVYRSSELSSDMLSFFDLVLVVTDHSDLDKDLIKKHSKLIVDCRNAIDPRGFLGKLIKA
tara:strand:+ start:2783 stop:4081 length:1299 start_codon:yes stop_codon:yes gene_type:complete